MSALSDLYPPGKLVRIHGATESLRAVSVRDALDANDFSYQVQEGSSYDCVLDGQAGQCLDRFNAPPETCTVRTVEGHVAEVPVNLLEEYAPPPIKDGGFDVAWPVNDEGGPAFGSTVGQMLADRGYCLVQMFMSAEDQQDALSVATRIGTEHEFKEELEVDFMGRDNYTKVKKLPVDDLEASPADALALCERQLSQIGMMVGPVTPSLFGFETIGRSASFSRMRYASKSEASKGKPAPLDEDDVIEGVVSDHIKFVQSRKICMLFLLGSEGGNVILYPKEGKDITIPLAKSRILIFRHDQMTFSYKPLGQSLALQSWLLRDVPEFELAEITGGGLEIDRVYEIEGPDRMQGTKFQIMSMQTRFPGACDDPVRYWSAVTQGTDAVSQWPFQRFDLDLYYTPDGQTAAIMGKSYTEHGGFLSYTDLVEFANTFFGISEEEAYTMSWHQRNVLEVSYDALYKGGWTRESLHGKHIGFYIGDCGSDNHTMTVFAGLQAYDPDLCATGIFSPVVPGRLGYIYNLIGPTMTFDTACSSSLVATHHGHVNMLNFNRWGWDCDGGLCGGVNTTGPLGFCGACGASMLSHLGRCFTFDKTSDGFCRGEGTAMLYAKMETESEERIATMAGSCANQDGKSASLTAPNGPSQQAVLRWSLRMAGVTPDYVTVVECHGTGTALGDPIEVGAVMAVMDGEREDPLPHTSAKSNMGHLEAAAGIAGLLKCLVILLHSAGTPNCHLRAMNPHLESTGFPQIFEVELICTNKNAGYCGVSSFGFGGTNSRGDLYAKAKLGPSAKVTPNLAKVDLLTVVCPRCMGNMSYNHRVAVPSFSTKMQHPCALVRDEFANYDFCSNCHAGEFRYGDTIEDIFPWAPDYKVYISGTWNGFSAMDEMELIDDATYVCAIALGETRVERFQLNLFENSANAIYPISNWADDTIRIEGPDDGGSEKWWTIDGRDEQIPCGTLYQITFHWGDPKQIRWEVINQEPELPLGFEYQHRYFISGSWNKWDLMEMKPSKTEKGMWEDTFAIRNSGKEQFQFVRDRDFWQRIYPAEKKAETTDIAVRGPDKKGHAKNWYVKGKRKEVYTVQLRVRDGRISVTVISPREESKVWTNIVDKGYHTYCLTGNFNSWTYTMMIPDKLRPGVFKYHLTLSDTVEQFNVIVDEDRTQTLHPISGDAMCGQDIVQGPDDQWQDLPWMIVGDVGSMVEITVDPHHEDKRMIVSWKPVTKGMLADN